LIPKARAALENGDYSSIGKIMQENHGLLQEIEVSCEELDLLVEVSIKNGALGAKLTGTGRGGYMIALTPGQKLQEKVASAIKDLGFSVLKTSIGV
jgi:mevalonate kinase